ncbi:MAG: N-formylglutamate amidohydrolase [Neoaquamicrobium sediminum]|uniref:N-formylglutamate amidohydrolase n=1 Tax=Neoaquamicrobium sediminum TaxID=1849104 RepID=UPI004035A662
MSRQGEPEDPPQAVSVRRPDGEELPLLYDSPHSGRVYPEDFLPAAEMRLLLGGEDRFVDDLVIDAPSHGATLIKALFARTYIDPNRTPDDLDPHLLPEDWAEETAPSVNSERGVGLIFRLIGDAVPIYDRLLSADEIRHRIDAYWRPYHAALEDEMARLTERFGEVLHINWHSMQPVGNALAPDPGQKRPDFVLGDLYGTSCDPALTRFVADHLSALGYSVGLNDPYKGALIVERYGKPEEGRHTLQIEINRALYMDHGTLDRTGGFADLKDDLSTFTDELAGFARARLN